MIRTISEGVIASGRLLKNPIALRKALADAGVPYGKPGFDQALAHVGCKAKARNFREALLMAVGLVPYRLRKA